MTCRITIPLIHHRERHGHERRGNARNHHSPWLSTRTAAGSILQTQSRPPFRGIGAVVSRNTGWATRVCSCENNVATCIAAGKSDPDERDSVNCSSNRKRSTHDWISSSSAIAAARSISSRLSVFRNWRDFGVDRGSECIRERQAQIHQARFWNAIVPPLRYGLT